MNLPSRDELSELVKAAGVKLRLRNTLRYVPEEITLPEVRDFLAITNKSGGEGILLYGDTIAPFTLTPRVAKTGGRVAAIICDICATWRRGPESASITFRKGDKNTVTFLVCADLDCSLHVRDLTPVGVLSRSQIRETIIPEQRIERLNDRLTRILDCL